MADNSDQYQPEFDDAFSRIDEIMETIANEKTRRAYRRDVEAFMEFLERRRDEGKSFAPNGITLKIYRTEMLTTGMKKRTINRRLFGIRYYFKELKSNNYYDHDMTNVRGFSVKGEPNTNPLSPDESASFIRECRRRKDVIGLRNDAIFSLMYHNGLREESLILAEIRDIRNHPNPKKLEHLNNVYQLRVYMKRRGNYDEDGNLLPDRWVVIKQSVYAKIIKYLAVRGEAQAPDDPLFLSHSHISSGKRWSTNAVRKTFKKIAEAAGIDAAKFSPHSFRSTYATKLAEKGIAPGPASASMCISEQVYMNTYNKHSGIERLEDNPVELLIEDIR